MVASMTIFWPSGHQSRNGHQRPLWELNIAHVKKHPHLPTKMLLSPTVRNLPPPTPLSKCLPYKEFGHIIFSNSASRYKVVHIKTIRFYFLEKLSIKYIKMVYFGASINIPLLENPWLCQRGQNFESTHQYVYFVIFQYINTALYFCETNWHTYVWILQTALFEDINTYFFILKLYTITGKSNILPQNMCHWGSPFWDWA